MKKSVWTKGIVFGIIMLFVGTVAVQGVSNIEDIIKDCIFLNHKELTSDQSTVSTQTSNLDSLDQSNTNTQGAGLGLFYPNGYVLAQSFTPEFTDLTRIQLFMFKVGDPTGDIKVSIKDSLDGQDLTSTVVDVDVILDTGNWIEFDFSDINITKGKQYYIVAEAISGSSYQNKSGYWVSDFFGSYTSGDGWLNDGIQWHKIEFGEFDIDFDFKTYGNAPPDPPYIDGPSEVKIITKTYFDITVHEREFEDVYIYINWGDGKNSGWLGPFEEDEEQSIAHRWWKKGDYNIMVKAKDTDDLESDWAILPVTLPKSKTIFMPLFIQSFPFFEKIIKQSL